MTFDELPELVSMALDHVKTTKELLREQYDSIAPGSMDLNDAEFLVWYMRKRAESPLLPCTSPEGVEVMGSPWELALPYVDGGAAVVKRWERILGDGVRQGWVEGLPHVSAEAQMGLDEVRRWEQLIAKQKGQAA